MENLYYKYMVDNWILKNWETLQKGKEIVVPSELVHHLQEAGFRETLLAEPHEQIRDWSIKLTDESRIHVHEFPDGKFIAHRDSTDPDLSVLHALWHWFTESTSGKIALSVLIAFGIRWIVKRARR